MSDFVILTDSSADLSADMVRDLGVQVLPLSFEMDEKIYHNYPDNREMDPHQFYELLRNGHTATTSAVNVAQYTELIEPLLQAGQDILILAFSSGLSTTFSSSAIAVDELREKYPERKVYTVDTLCASLGQGMLVWLAVQEQRKGRSIEQTVFISHGDCLEDAEMVAQMVRDRFGVQTIYINYVGPVIGAHTGPGVVALFYVGSER